MKKISIVSVAVVVLASALALAASTARTNIYIAPDGGGSFALDRTEVLLVDAKGGAVTVALVACNANTKGRHYIVKRTDGLLPDAGQWPLTLDPSGAQKIERASTYAITGQHGYDIACDGAGDAGWWVTGTF